MILTHTGRLVNPLALQPDDVSIVDIAHALACTNRYAGHSREPLSVAQHSVYVSWICRPDEALMGLLHDASEAYLGDMTKWVKKAPEMAAFRAAEDRAQRVIFAKFGCALDISPEVEAADKLMLRYEAVQPCIYGRPLPIDAALGYGAPTEDELASLPPWELWDWREAQREFLVRFGEVMG